jgi:hypothetical protein
MTTKIRQTIKPFKKRYMLSAMINYWENNNGRFNLSLYSEVLKAKLQKSTI